MPGLTKHIIVGALLFCSAMSLNAQQYFGVKGGYSMSAISFKPDMDQMTLFGAGIDNGLIFKYYNDKYAGFQGELFYSQRGYRLPRENGVRFKRINRYIELPIFFQLRLNLKLAHIFVNAGPYAAYLLSAVEGDNASGKFELRKVDFNILRDNRFDYGLCGGVGLFHEFRWGVIQAEARVLYGFADLYVHDYDNMPKESKAVVQSVNISYLYNFGRLRKQ